MSALSATIWKRRERRQPSRLGARLDRVKGSALAADDRMTRGVQAQSPSAPRSPLGARRIEHFAAAVDCSLSVRGVNGVGISRVAPDRSGPLGREPRPAYPRLPLRVAGRPERLRPPQTNLATGPTEGARRDVADAHHRAAGHWAPVELEMGPASSPRRRRMPRPESAVARRLFDLSRLGGLSHELKASTRTTAANQRRGRNRLDRRLRIETIPGDEDLRLATQHQRGAVEFGVGSRELRLKFLNAASRSAANQMEHSGYRRQQHQQ